MNTLVPWDPRMPELWRPLAVSLLDQADLMGCRGEKTIVNCLGVHGFSHLMKCLWGTFLGVYPFIPHLLQGQEPWQI